MAGKPWTSEELELLRTAYPRMTPAEAEVAFNRRFPTIYAKALREGIKLERPKYLGRRHTREYQRTGALSNLLNGSPEAYYWLGFYLADGSIAAGDRRFVMASADREHLEAFSRFVEHPEGPKEMRRSKSTATYPNRTPLYHVTLSDVATCRSLRGFLGVGVQKTYEPPTNLHLLPMEAFLALLVGFIDGDGCITKSTRSESISLAIELHPSWGLVLLEIVERATHLGFVLPQPRVYRRGYVKLSVSNAPFLKKLHQFALEHSLPVLRRKWDKVPLANPRKYTFRAETTAR